MKIIEQKEENRQVLATVELDKQDLAPHMEKAYKKIAKKVDIPGFRKGKAPKNVLDNYLGKDAVLEEAIDRALTETCASIIKEQEIDVFAQPSVELLQKEPVKFKAVIPLAPVVELGDYKSIKTKEKKVKVTQKQVDDTINQLRNQRATWESVERAALLDDMAVIDVTAFMKGAKEEKPVIDYKQAQYPLKTDAIYPAPGFSEQLVGLKKDDKKEFSLSYPDDYEQQEMAGKELEFSVVLHEVKEKKLPKVTDEFIKEIEPEAKDLEDLMQKIKASIKDRLEDEAKQEFEEELLDDAIKLSKISYPPIMEEFEIQNILNQHLQRLSMMMRSKEDFEKTVTKEYLEDLKEKYKPVAEKRITQSLLLNKISEQENIEVSEEEITAEIDKLVENAGEKKKEQKEQLSTPEGKGRVKDMLVTEKILDILKEAAKQKSKKPGAAKPKAATKKTEGVEK